MDIKHNLFEEIPPLLNKPSGTFSKYLLGACITLAFFIIIFSSTAFLYTKKFAGKIAPNVLIGNMDVGGKDPEVARQLLHKRVDFILTNGIALHLNDEARTLGLASVIGSDAKDHVQFNVDSAIEKAVQVYRHSNPLLDTVYVISGFLRPPVVIPVDVLIDTETIAENTHVLFASFEEPSSNATFKFSSIAGNLQINADPGVYGKGVDTDALTTNLTQALSHLKTDPIEITLIQKGPTISLEKVEEQIPLAQNAMRSAPYVFTHTNEHKKVTEWKLNASTLQLMLIPTEDAQLGLEESAFVAFLKPISTIINVPAKDARFKMENERVIEFVQSEDGVELNTERLKQDLLSAIRTASTTHISLSTSVVKSEVLTRKVNNLGIGEKLGYGISSYKGSPTNRKKNIQNGVNLLNGRLIAPNETFSLLAALQPFTKENGYLPELVIKGDEIIPEIGGGLCQIGTTTFRAVMHAGLAVTERRNHSLVVNYYNDPSNGKPGTDATLYEPAPDFKFTNDTGQYLLLQAENLTDIQELRFTFYGTSDGRKGSYTPPVVSAWFPAGATVYTVSPTLKPGEEKCQEAHKGAHASFTYSVARADGTVDKRIFNSRYRSLPKICLIGIDPTKTKEIDEIPLP